ncbi:MAG: CotH kinase family protein, partial [Oscillospiraceae bacterium]|nr:CotH kinase family protein [Oscillospiraceae bacterium]
MRKKLVKAVTSIAVIAAAAAQLSALTVSAAETQYEAGKYARIYIDTEQGNGNQIEKADGYQKSAITVVSPAEEGKSYTEKGKMKVRGNSTGRAEKKPFNIKLDKKQDVLGMGKSKKWCLLANCFDPSLMRNYTAFEIARELGLQYTPDCRFAELWVDGVYKGSYLVTDPIESGSTSIDIDTDAEDFMIEFEAYRDEELVTYVTSDEGNLRFAISEPEMPDPADYKEEEMEQYYADEEAYELRAADISAIVNNVTDTIKNGTYEEMCEVIDMESFVDFYLLNEIMKTCDFGWSSVNFYYTASDGKLHAGPAWDFDLSSGNTNPDYPSLVTDESEIAYTQYFTDFASNPASEGLYAANYNFYQYLTANEEFMNEVKTEFLEKQDAINALISEGGKIDQVCDEYREMFENNFTPADDDGAGWIASKSYAQTMRIPDDTFAENYAFFKNWLAERTSWLYET